MGLARTSTSTYHDDTPSESRIGMWTSSLARQPGPKSWPSRTNWSYTASALSVLHTSLTRTRRGPHRPLKTLTGASEGRIHRLGVASRRVSPHKLNVGFLAAFYGPTVPPVPLCGKLDRAPTWLLPQASKLGVYEVTAKIGAGGMGEVYRARDMKLWRDVC